MTKKEKAMLMTMRKKLVNVRSRQPPMPRPAVMASKKRYNRQKSKLSTKFIDY